MMVAAGSESSGANRRGIPLAFPLLECVTCCPLNFSSLIRGGSPTGKVCADVECHAWGCQLMQFDKLGDRKRGRLQTISRARAFRRAAERAIRGDHQARSLNREVFVQIVAPPRGREPQTHFVDHEIAAQGERIRRRNQRAKLLKPLHETLVDPEFDFKGPPGFGAASGSHGHRSAASLHILVITRVAEAGWKWIPRHG